MASGSRGGRSSAAAVNWRGWPFAAAVVVLIYGAHLARGAMSFEASQLVHFVTAGLLAAILLVPGLRRDLLGVSGLLVLGVLFILLIAYALLSLTPWAIGGPQAVWAFTEAGSPAGTLDKTRTTGEIIRLIGLACVFVTGVAAGASDDRARIVLLAIFWAGVAYAFWAIIIFVAGLRIGEVSQSNRLEASLFNPNAAGTLFAVLLAIGFGLSMRVWRSAPPRERLSRILPFAGGLLILITALGMSGSRGATAALLAGLVVFAGLQFLIGETRLTWRRTAPLLAASAAVFALLLSSDLLLSRLGGIDAEFNNRTPLFAMHWDAFLARPWSGYGLGVFDILHQTLLDASTFESQWRVRGAHNVYLEWLLQVGVIGVVPMFAAIGFVLFRTVRGVFERSRMTSVLCALVAADVVFLVHGLSDFALEIPSMSLLWSFLLGLQFSLARSRGRS